MRILVQGAGIAGPTLAWWLQRSSHEVVLVEQAPHLRTGGYVIDFWGIGYAVAESKVGGFGTGVFDRVTRGLFTSVRRFNLSAVICDALAGKRAPLIV